MTTARVSSARVDAALHQSLDPIFLIGSDRRFLYVNQAWEQLTGRASEEVLAWNPAQPSNPRTEPLASVVRSFAPPSPDQADEVVSHVALIVHRDGTRVWRRLEFHRINQAEPMAGCWLAFVRDANEQVPSRDDAARTLRYQLLEIRHQQACRYGLDQVVGSGPAHGRILEQIRVAASTSSPVTIVGPTGSGKRFVARVIHQESLRRHSPLIPLDCAVLPPAILERELFGAEEHSGTSLKTRFGSDATLLLLNATELPRDLQARLMAALERGPRLIATSAVPLDLLLSEGRLCEEYYYALTTQTISMRPLSERRSEIRLLAQSFLERSMVQTARGPIELDTGAIEALEAYSWPGNLSELARVIDVAVSASEGNQLRVEHLPADLRGHQGEANDVPILAMENLDELLTRVERRLIEQALARSQQNKSRAADLLGISRPRLYRRIRELGIPDDPEPSINGNG